MTCNDCIHCEPCEAFSKVFKTKWLANDSVETTCPAFKSKSNYLNATAFIKAIDKYAEVLKGNVFSVEKMADDIKELIKRCLE